MFEVDIYNVNIFKYYFFNYNYYSYKKTFNYILIIAINLKKKI